MIPFIPFLIVTSLYEVLVEGMEYDGIFHTSAYCDLTCMKYLLRGWSTMILLIPFLIVTALYEVFIEGMEYDDIFPSSAHCDLTVWSIYWGDGVRWHLSYIFSLWSHCMNYLLREWSMMTPFTPLLIVTSLTEVFIERMEYDDTFHTSARCDLTDRSIYWGDRVRWHLSYMCSLWPHCMNYLLIGWSTMTHFIPVLVVTSLTEVFIEGTEYDDTFHTSASWDLTDRSIYWGDGVRWHLSYLCSLWPHCMKYLLRGWSMMTPFIPFSYCDLTVYSIYWGDGVRWHLSYIFSLWPHCMKYLLRGHSTMTPFIHFDIVTSLYLVFIEGMEYDDIFHTSAHCDITAWGNYWGDGVRWYLSYLFSLWPPFMKY
jgi:hypothetical protein